MKLIKKILYFIIIQLKIKYRKEAIDWGISIKKWSKIRFFCFFIIILIIVIATITIIQIYDNYTYNKQNLIDLLYVYLILIISFESSLFFSNNKKVFFEENTKIVSNAPDFRYIKVISNCILHILRQLIFYNIAILLPVFIYSNAINIHSIIHYIKIVGFFTLVSTFLSLATSYFNYSFQKIFLKNKSIKYKSIINYLLILIFSFSLVFFAVSTFLDKELINRIYNFYKRSNLNIITDYFYKITNNNFIYIFIGMFLVFITYILLKIWKITLKKHQLLIYSNISYVDQDASASILNTKNLFFVKDILHIKRLNGWFLKYLKKSLFVVFIVAGLVIPIVTNYWGDKNYMILAIPIFLSITVFELIGDCFKSILSVDTEKNHIYIILRKKNLWDLIKEKWFIYLFLTLTFSIIITLLSLSYNHNFLITFTTFMIVFSYGAIYGLIQIANTGLYPKLNWEHSYEIGQSEKAERLTQIIQYILSIFYFNSILLIFLKENINIDISFNILLYSLNGLYFLSSIIVWCLYRAFLKNKYLEEVFIWKNR